jgi:hypothetical protein
MSWSKEFIHPWPWFAGDILHQHLPLVGAPAENIEINEDGVVSASK